MNLSLFLHLCEIIAISHVPSRTSDHPIMQGHTMRRCSVEGTVATEFCRRISASSSLPVREQVPDLRSTECGRRNSRQLHPDVTAIFAWVTLLTDQHQVFDTSMTRSVVEPLITSPYI